MNKEEAIKYLQQLYPNGGHCWLDEQRTEAIGMAIKALQEEPVSPCVECASISEGCKEICYDYNKWVRDNHKEEPVSNSDWLTELQEKLDNATPEQLEELWNKYNGVDEKEPVSEELKEAAIEICSKILKGETVVIDGYEYVVLSDAEECFKVGAKWQKVKSKMDILEEPVSENLEEAIKVASEKERMRKAESESPFFMPADFASGFKVGVKWQQERIEETLLSEVLPLFMHGGEADEVIAKLEEVLYYKEKED